MYVVNRTHFSCVDRSRPLMPVLGIMLLLTAKRHEGITCGYNGNNPKELRAMEWSNDWFIANNHEDARDKGYMTTWRHPTLMLRDLVANDLLCYPTTLSISEYGYGGFDSGDDGVTESSYSEVAQELTSFPQSIGSLVKACPYLDKWGTIASGILDKGQVGATLGFLMTLLPNLTTLKAVGSELSVSYGSTNLRSVLENIRKICYCRKKKTTSRRVSPPLAKLRCLELTEDKAVRAYAPLFRLPSISTIRAHNVRAYSTMLQCPGFHIDVTHSLRTLNSHFEVRNYCSSLERCMLNLKSHIATTS